MMSGPLSGLRVLDISNVIAGPFAAALLGDFGADVLKVELPGGGDPLRALPPHKDGKPLLWKAVNRNKRAVTLDLRKPEGRALLHRANHPDAPGQEIALSCTEAMMRLLEVLPIEYDQLGLVHEPVGAGNAYVSPSGMFRASDGAWISFTAATQNVFQRLCRLIGREDLLADPRYASNQQRMQHQPELNAIVTAWIGARPARDVVRELSEAGVAVAPVYSNRDIAEDVHVQSREAITRVADADFGSVA